MRGGVDPGVLGCCPRVVGVEDGGVSHPGWRWRLFSSLSQQWGWGFNNSCGVVSTRETICLSPGCRSWRNTEEFPNRGWQPIGPGSCKTGVTLSGNFRRACRSVAMAKGGRAGGGLGKWGCGSENAKLRAVCLLCTRKNQPALRALLFFLGCAERRLYDIHVEF